jgi:glycosyltransferase involved in cell wall biosynthesis
MSGRVLFFLGFGASYDGEKKGVCGPEIRLRNMFNIFESDFIPILFYPSFGSLIEDFRSLDKENKICLIEYLPKNKLDVIVNLIKVIRDNSKIEFIHCHGPYLFDNITVLLSKYFKKKSVISRLVNISQDHLSTRKSFLFRVLDRMIVSRANCLVTISKTHFSQWLEELGGAKYISKKMRVVYNGIDLKRFQLQGAKQASENICFAIVAQLTSVKGHGLLLRAVRQLHLDGFDFFVKIVGDGPLREELELYTKKYNLDSIVSFTGMVNKVEIILQDVGVVVLPSHREGFPVSLLEASAMKCALIASDVGANAELVETGKNGYLIEKGDYKSLYASMRKCIESPDKVREMGEYAYQKVQQYDLETMTKGYDQIYDELSSEY